MYSNYGWGLLSITHADKEIASHLKAQPATGHAGSNFEKIGPNSFEEATHPFLGHNDPDSIPYRAVLVAHAGHGVNLESAAQYITRRIVRNPVSQALARRERCKAERRDRRRERWEEGQELTKDMCMFEQLPRRWHQQVISDRSWGSCLHRVSGTCVPIHRS